MKSNFAGYYPPTPDEYERLWKEATIVLDTNVLLNLYRLPTSARDEFLTVLDLLKDRLWIPHQVALEFQRRRLTVIASERKSTEDALGSAQAVVGELRKKVEALQIEKRGLGIDTKPILDDLEHANDKLVGAIKTAHISQLEIASVDPVRERLDSLLDSRVGPAPKSQAELDELVKDGDDRFRDRIPPGFADIDKDKNPNEAIFIHDHLKYQRKFGDLILWRQLLRQAKTASLKCVLLVTADRKEDWWWREQGKTIGAHPELIGEIQREAAVDLFWMYSSVQFIEHANEYTGASVSTQAVQELQQVVIWPDLVRHQRDFVAHSHVVHHDTGPRPIRSEYPIYDSGYDMRVIQERVAAWLTTRNRNVLVNTRGFPDLIVSEDQGVHGYEIKYLRHFDRMLLSPGVINSILRGYLETKEGRLTSFTMIIVISENSFYEIVDSDNTGELNRRLTKLLSRYPIDSIVVGAVLGDAFEVLTWQREQVPSYLIESPEEP